MRKKEAYEIKNKDNAEEYTGMLFDSLKAASLDFTKTKAKKSNKKQNK